MFTIILYILHCTNYFYNRVLKRPLSKIETSLLSFYYLIVVYSNKIMVNVGFCKGHFPFTVKIRSLIQLTKKLDAFNQNDQLI